MCSYLGRTRIALAAGHCVPHVRFLAAAASEHPRFPTRPPESEAEGLRLLPLGMPSAALSDVRLEKQGQIPRLHAVGLARDGDLFGRAHSA